MRSKRRMVWISVLALAVVLAGAAAGWWRYVNQVPEIPPQSVRLPSPNAYDDYLAATALLVQKPTRLVSPSDLPAAERRTLLIRNREALERLRGGFQHEYANPPVEPPGRHFPELQDFEVLGRLLLLEGKQAETEGLWAEAAESYLDCLQLGVDLPKGGTTVHAVFGADLQGRALEALQQCSPRLNGGTALRALREMRELNRTSPALREILVSDREATLRFLVHDLRTTSPIDTAPVQHLVQAPGPAFDYLLTPKVRMLASYRAYMDRWIERASQPYYDPAPRPEKPRDFLNQYLVSSTDGVWNRWTLRDAQWRVVEASLAIRAYESAHGQPPTSLRQLVPTYLPAVPTDPYAPQPLVFRRAGNKARVYSRGPDGDDDQGFQASVKAPYGDGDLVRVVSRWR